MSSTYRLNPKKADLELWRQTFAQALRDRGVEAEATPRRARGVTRKAERTPLRKIRDRHESGKGSMAQVRQAAYRQAAGAAFQGRAGRTAWEQGSWIGRGLCAGCTSLRLDCSANQTNPADRVLGANVEAFERDMPQADTQRLALAREIRAANEAMRRRDGDRERSR